MFLKNNQEYAYEMDFTGKTAVSYACYRNKDQIAAMIMQVGVNTDWPCFNCKTALNYAIANRNVDLSRDLLQRGASPWSTASNPYA
jgi:ankyrin repeat protein